MLVELRAGALMITADGLFADRRDQIVARTRRYLVPGMSQTGPPRAAVRQLSIADITFNWPRLT